MNEQEIKKLLNELIKKIDKVIELLEPKEEEPEE